MKLTFFNTFYENRWIGFVDMAIFYISQCLTMVVAILKTLSRDQNRKIIIYRIWFVICTGKQFNFIVLYKRDVYILAIYLHYSALERLLF